MSISIICILFLFLIPAIEASPVFGIQGVVYCDEVADANLINDAIEVIKVSSQCWVGFDNSSNLYNATSGTGTLVGIYFNLRFNKESEKDNFVFVLNNFKSSLPSVFRIEYTTHDCHNNEDKQCSNFLKTILD